MKVLKRKPKILIFDIETMANLGWIWGKYEQNVIEYEQEWYTLCFAYKWLHEKKIHTVSIRDFPLYKKDKTNDQELVKAIWKLFDEADIVMAHNGDSFDIKKMYARFLFHKMLPPSPVKSIDTKKIAKKHFNFNSNKLDDLCRILGIGRKTPHTGWDLWKGCYNDDDKSWRMMLKYNKNDVLLLEELYLRLLPYITNHPNLNIFTEINGCPNCMSSNVHKRGVKMGLIRAVQRFQCQDCGSWSHGESLKTSVKIR